MSILVRVHSRPIRVVLSCSYIQLGTNSDEFAGKMATEEIDRAKVVFSDLYISFLFYWCYRCAISVKPNNQLKSVCYLSLSSVILCVCTHQQETHVYYLITFCHKTLHMHIRQKELINLKLSFVLSIFILLGQQL